MATVGGRLCSCLDHKYGWRKYFLIISRDKLTVRRLGGGNIVVMLNTSTPDRCVGGTHSTGLKKGFNQHSKHDLRFGPTHQQSVGSTLVVPLPKKNMLGRGPWAIEQRAARREAMLGLRPRWDLRTTWGPTFLHGRGSRLSR